ncbi:hypothetical protein FAM09_10745 [Niastella caeni]|uniref:NodB homology domain-containing protein n=1 Tax=Niastella caeni TaxID=2569763 RepID=A0A4S8HXD5_9BACT|nr:polysaccharide deacetylase family protein [Niastella caeni]THU40337.1 hypothetical protein FAM09_10745 [Niastella caeni]
MTVKKEVYLTFDDGIQAGTEEVLSILKQTNVPATFYLIGKHLFNAYEKDRHKCMWLLNEIYQNHSIGNHSYYHGNDEYRKYYEEGICVDDTWKCLTVLQDFEKNEDELRWYLQELRDNFRANGNDIHVTRKTVKLARLPGSNSWVYSKKTGDAGSDLVSKLPGKQTGRWATKLFDIGYQVFGWDVEWEMNFDFYNEALQLKEDLYCRNGKDNPDSRLMNFDIDMYANENVLKDRLTETWEQVAGKVLKLQKDKIVLLMHDRAFRRGMAFAGKAEETEKLRALILYLKGRGIIFKTLDQY